MLDKYKNKLANDREVYLRIKLLPKFQKNEIRGEMSDGTIKIAVAAPAEKGRANQALCKFLAKELAIDKKNVKIISGVSSRIKLIKIIK